MGHTNIEKTSGEKNEIDQGETKRNQNDASGIQPLLGGTREQPRQLISPTSSCSPILSPLRSPQTNDDPLLEVASLDFPADDEANIDYITTITDQDVLCGRGAGTNAHPGNVHFRTLVSHCQPTYVSAKALVKAEIADGIVKSIRSSGGRFLKKVDLHRDARTGLFRWRDIGDKAREKTCQALREKSNSSLEEAQWLYTKHQISKLPETVVFNAQASETSLKTRKETSAVEITPTDADVLLGRGGVSNAHVGNVKYRQLIRQHQRAYLTSAKNQKAIIAQHIVNMVYSNGGRFLEQRGGVWREVLGQKPREKTSQCLREKAPELRQTYVAAECLLRNAAEAQEARFPNERKRSVDNIGRLGMMYGASHKKQHSTEPTAT